MSNVDHPAHYGGADNVYETIKVIEAWKLGFNLGNTVKYICRAGKKVTTVDTTTLSSSQPKYVLLQQKRLEELTDLKKARWYLDREITKLEREGE